MSKLATKWFVMALAIAAMGLAACGDDKKTGTGSSELVPNPDYVCATEPAGEACMDCAMKTGECGMEGGACAEAMDKFTECAMTCEPTDKTCCFDVAMAFNKCLKDSCELAASCLPYKS
ncbi:hypothetical protein [Vulgatibacter incomptus]|uniref:Lipoprotein n=1 Tax=Vulgatibacter incomptus TaxID=1391653 RepID=A0A0K1P9A0_9BACT|nr:hypothetical protein [Vulgatibacter incomptus]AKU89996.1 hypothetical protein AKJ08_0383 [Vulgatibacter incomptus]